MCKSDGGFGIGKKSLLVGASQVERMKICEKMMEELV